MQKKSDNCNIYTIVAASSTALASTTSTAMDFKLARFFFPLNVSGLDQLHRIAAAEGNKGKKHVREAILHLYDGKVIAALCLLYTVFPRI